MNKGFTLAELLVILAIFVIVIVGISSTLFLTKKSLTESRNISDVNHEGRKILERLSREIRQAKEIVTELPQVDTDSDPSEIEFEDGHTPSPYQELGSDFYYIRYFLNESGQIRRQYRVYCFDDCEICQEFYRWSETRLEGVEEKVHPCNLTEAMISRHITNLEFFGKDLINIKVSLEKGDKKLNLKTKVFGRNL